MKKLEERVFRIKDDVILTVELIYKNHEIYISSRIERLMGCFRKYGEFGYGYRLTLMRDIKQYSKKVGLNACSRFDYYIVKFVSETLKQGGFIDESKNVKNFMDKTCCKVMSIGRLI